MAWFLSPSLNMLTWLLNINTISYPFRLSSLSLIIHFDVWCFNNILSRWVGLHEIDTLETCKALICRDRDLVKLNLKTGLDIQCTSGQSVCQLNQIIGKKNCNPCSSQEVFIRTSKILSSTPPTHLMWIFPKLRRVRLTVMLRLIRVRKSPFFDPRLALKWSSRGIWKL